MVLKRPVKRLVALLKGVRLSGDASVNVRSSVRGPGRCLLEDGARIGPRVAVDLRGGTLVLREGAAIPSDAVIRVGSRIEIGRQTSVMHYTVIYGEGDVVIGDRVLLGNHCLVASTTHNHSGRAGILGQGMRTGRIEIGDDVWVGAYTLIDPGVTVGEGAIIAAHSYVRDDVPAFSVVGGVPARVLKMRDEGEID